MPRVRTLNDTEYGTVFGLARPAQRVRRAHLLCDDRPIEDPDVAKRPVPPRVPRYLLVQEYADQGRDVGQAIEFGDEPWALLDHAQDGISDGWLPAVLHDLDTGDWWGVDVVPTLCGPGQPARPTTATGEVTA